MMKTKYRRSILCVLIALFFLIGILANVNRVKIVSWNMVHREVQSAINVCVNKGKSGISAQLLPIKTIDEMDDFQARTVRRRENQETEEVVRTIEVVFMVIAILQLLHTISLENSFCFRKKRIHIFEVIRFIHQIDGKKKSYFA